MKSQLKKQDQPFDALAGRISTLIEEGRKRAIVAVNLSMVYTYFEVGRMIVEEEQNGKDRAEYGTALIKGLSIRLTGKFGKGFSQRNLEQMRHFYLVFSKAQTLSAEFETPQISISQTVSGKSKKGQKPSDLLATSDEFPIAQTVSAQLDPPQVPQFTLSWSHYLKLMRIDNPDERRFYEIEATEGGWSLRELQRQFDASLYERLVLSRKKTDVKKLSQKGQVIDSPQDMIKDPYVLEFIGLPELPIYSESELEQRLIDNLQTFLLELGKGFTFVGRQQRFTFDEQHFRVDLVFYNRILRSFVLIDLKRGTLKHQDLGQMQMYVNYYDRFIKREDENPSIGILLCADKSNAIVEITLPKDNSQIFASKYQTILPSKAELKNLIEKQL